MHLLVELYGLPGWVAALTPLSVGAMIVAASTTLLADSRAGQRGGPGRWKVWRPPSLSDLCETSGTYEISVAKQGETGPLRQ
jgi:hypothetical protein